MLLAIATSLLTLGIHSVIPLSLFMSYFEHDCDMIVVGLLRQKSCCFYHYDCAILTPGASQAFRERSGRERHRSGRNNVVAVESGTVFPD